MKTRAPLTAAVVGAIAVLVGHAMLELRELDAGLAADVAENVAASGVAHPVTAVLLNFRGYDTWLELIVLVVAALGALQGRLQTPPAASRLAWDRLTAWLLVALVPLMVLVAGHILLAGAYRPGGAFQAGAVLAAALVLMHLTGRTTLQTVPVVLVRGTLVLGAAAFALASVAGLAFGDALLAYPAGYAGFAIIGIEVAATLSIALALGALVIGQMEG